jgi:putative ABC transport system permease protein
MFETLWQDVRYACRVIRRSHGYAFTVVIVMALGVAANAAVFSMFNAAFLRPLPGVDDASQLAVLVGRAGGGRMVTVSYPDYRYLREHDTGFSGLASSSPAPLTLGTATETRRIWGEFVSGNYFQVLGVTPRIGRTLLPSDERSPGSDPVAVISEQLWQRAFASDPAIVGRTILVNAHPLTIVGVAEPGFHGSVLSLVLDIFVPLTMRPELQPPFKGLTTSTARWLIPIGRVAPGTSIAQATARTELITARLAADDPVTDVNERATVVPLWRSPFGAQTFLLPIVGVLGVTGILVLIVVCTNLANLALAHGLTRRSELATRVAMGASGGRIVRLLVLENVVLAIPACAVGILASTRLFGVFASASPSTVTIAPSQFDTSVDGLVIGFALAISCATAIVFSLVPAVHGARLSLAASMREGSQRSPKARVRGALVVAQIAASLLLLVAAGLTWRTLGAARNADIGLNPNQVVSVHLDLSTSGYDDARGRTFYQALLDNLRARPGIESASLAEFVPMRMIEGRSRAVAVDGYQPGTDEDMRVAVNTVGPGYFETLQIGLSAGRPFSRDDVPTGAPVVIVNETAARRFWRTPADAIGKRIRVGGAESDWRTVIGVARDIKYLRLNEPPTPYLYTPLAQDYRAEMTLHARGAAQPGDVIDRIRTEVRALDAGVPVLDTRTLTEEVRSSLVLYESAASALMAFGLIAIGLAAVGIYGLVSYSVKHSTHEIGVRIALGAQRRDVSLRYLTRGMRLGVIGAVIGAVVAWTATRLMTAVLYGVSPTDPLAFGGAMGLVLGIALFASFLPSWRAASTDPIQALRQP